MLLRAWVWALIAVTAGCAGPSSLVIADRKAAQDAVLRHIALHLKAEQALYVSPLLVLGESVPGFGAPGDRFWEVCRTDMQVDFKVDGLFWVHAQTGAIRQVHPRPLVDSAYVKP